MVNWRNPSGPNDLAGKVVVVTGATAGVGFASAREFAGRGCDLALLAREPERLKEAVSEIESEGVRCLGIPVDVSDAEAVDRAAGQVEQELGPIDVWVNDAMAAIFARVWDIEPDEIRRATEVTYLGAVYGTMAALKRMRPRGHGSIVQVGSALAYRAIPLQAAYCASKFALRGFTDSLRTELMNEDSGISLTMVQLPGLNTPQFTWVRVRGLSKMPRPVAPVYSPEVAARAVVEGATTGRREVWAGISTVLTILGNRFFAPFGDRYLAKTNISGQLTDVPVPEDHDDYLFDPVPGPPRTDGTFSDEAKTRSVQLELSRHRKALFVGATAAAITATAISRLAKSR